MSGMLHAGATARLCVVVFIVSTIAWIVSWRIVSWWMGIVSRRIVSRRIVSWWIIRGANGRTLSRFPLRSLRPGFSGRSGFPWFALWPSRSTFAGYSLLPWRSWGAWHSYYPLAACEGNPEGKNDGQCEYDLFHAYPFYVSLPGCDSNQEGDFFSFYSPPFCILHGVRSNEATPTSLCDHCCIPCTCVPSSLRDRADMQRIGNPILDPTPITSS